MGDILSYIVMVNQAHVKYLSLLPSVSWTSGVSASLVDWHTAATANTSVAFSTKGTTP